MRIIHLTQETKQDILNDLLKRSPNHYSQYESTVNEIITNIRENGNRALFDYTLKFDKFALTEDNIKVTREEIDEAYEENTGYDEVYLFYRHILASLVVWQNYSPRPL